MKALLIRIGLLLLSATALQAQENSTAVPRKAIDITYIANEGFLISSRDSKVLIDGIFTEGFGKFQTPTAETLAKESQASPPFDNITALLVTHYHPDHINPAYVVQHLTYDTKAVLIAPAQANDRLKDINGYKVIEKQVVVASPNPNSAATWRSRDTSVKTVPLQHANNDTGDIQNLGFIITIGGFKLFHSGDANAADVSAYKSLNLADENIDVAFLPYWFLDEKNGGKGQEIIRAIKPKAIVLMHVVTGQADHLRSLVAGMKDIPPTYIMEKPMEMLSVGPDGVEQQGIK
jgi:L-ascorbate metabolism protein UlaG (beta-lactamase superfamily)